jgi:hypothetical protein|tara:strand:- start:9 stop:386 length:378 start_codon:yes stop_codon:yes gene_type:complete
MHNDYCLFIYFFVYLADKSVTPKKLQSSSKYAKYDLDGDGTVTDEEIQRHQDMVELELREEKADSQKQMAWVAMASMVLFSVFLMLPIMPDSRVNALSDLLGLFYIAQASVCGAYFGATAYMSRK